VKKLADKLRLTGAITSSDTLIAKAGGFSEWRKVRDAGWTLTNLFALRPKMAALFDRDYRSDAEVARYLAEFSGTGIHFRILRRKEIENYLLEMRPLTALIIERVETRGHTITAIDAEEILYEVSELLRHETLANISAAELEVQRATGLDTTTIIENTNRDFDSGWKNFSWRSAVCRESDS
jgi:hypothetical protein